MVEAVSTSKTSTNFYKTTLRYNPEDSHLHISTSSEKKGSEKKFGLKGGSEELHYMDSSRNRLLVLSTEEEWCGQRM
jgi:hypothetical protein